MDKQVDDIEAADNEGFDQGETPQMSEEVSVAMEGTLRENFNCPSDDSPSIEPNNENAVGNEETPIEISKSPSDLPPSLEVSEETSTSDTQENSSDSQSDKDKKGKGKEPIYSNAIPPPSESPAGPSTSTPFQPFQPNSSSLYSMPAAGQPVPWELDPERDAQKLPILLKDAVGRNYIIPWRRAKTWEGMKMTIDQAFDKVEGPLSVHVPAGHYDLSFTKATIEEESVMIPDDSSQPRKVVKPARPPPANSRPLIVLPDFWEDLIRPGMTVSMSMWPFDTPNMNGGRGVWPIATQAGRGMVGGNPGFTNPMNVAPPPPPPPGFINIVPTRSRSRSMRNKAKTRVNPGRPVRK